MPDALVARVRFGARVTNTLPSFALGNDVPIWVEVRNVITQEMTDDDTIAVVIYQADGEVLDPALTLTRQSEGLYYVAFQPDQPGVWTAAPATEADNVTVQPRRFSMDSATPAPAVVGPNTVDTVNGLPGPNPVIGAQHFSFTPTNGTGRTLADYLGESRLNVTSFNVDNTGDDDVTAALTTALSRGGAWYFPAGDYLIAGAGANAGGVVVTLTTSLDVLCHPNARFFTDTLDNDMFSFAVPDLGVGVPAGGVAVDWRGGKIEMRNMRVSTSVPFSNVYVPVNQGTSGTTEGLSFRLSYLDGGGAGIGAGRRVTVRDVVFDAGDHWETAGGDSGIFLGGGTGVKIVEGCTFLGCRDIGVYNSGEDWFSARGNTFVNCFFGVSSKRSTPGFEVAGNRFFNCVGAIVATTPSGGAKGALITGNVFERCTHFALLQETSGARVWGNYCISLGATLADNTTQVMPYSLLAGYWLRGATQCHVIGEQCHAVGAGYSAGSGVLVYLSDVNGTASTYNKVQDCTSTDLSRVVEEASGGADYTRIELCYNYGTLGLRDPLGAGSNSSAIRWGVTTSRHYHRSGIDIGDGTEALPSFARGGTPGTGLYFDGTTVGTSVAGAWKWRVTTTLIESDNRYRGPIGTEAAPAFSFVLDTSTGMYRAGTSRIGFATAGVQRLELSSTQAIFSLPIYANVPGPFADDAAAAAASPAVAVGRMYRRTSDNAVVVRAT